MKLRFGAIVTGAVGKAGGQNIQRFQNQYILRNIVQPTNSKKRFSNQQKIILARLSTLWTNLDLFTKNDWRVLGERMSKVDPFGGVSALTGRQAFFSINNFWQRYDNSITSPITVNLSPPSGTFSIATLNLTAATFTVPITSPIDSSFMEIRGIGVNGLQAYSRVQDAKTCWLGLQNDDTAAQFDSFVQTFGTVSPSSVIQLYGRNFNASGVPAQWQRIFLIIVP